MRVQAQPAFVLHARPWRETSLIVELLTRDHGRVGVVARGVQGAKRHPLRAALQPLQWLRVDFLPRGELARLLQAEALDAAPLLQGEALMAAFYVNELVLRLL
ncbi:MAG: DNA repair protein RecO, partial [Arenimonas sp.]|nr:DNA repair protein RecO [Arenimonas sp.]